MNNIHIPDPCHEDWSNMTPTERGAFCQKCSIDVYDFSKRSEEEIFKILLANKGKHLCGRFKTSQLEDLNNGYLLWKNQSRQTFQSKFALALIMVFGLTLFSCNQEEAAVIDLLHSDKQKVVNTVDPSTLSSIDQIAHYIENQQAYWASEMEIPEPPELDFIACEIMGDIAFEEAVLVEKEIYTSGMIAGGISYEPALIEYAELRAADTTEDSILPEEILNEKSLFETKVFPNPTHNQSTLQINVEKEGQFDIQLFNLSGQLIKIVHRGELLEGENRWQIDLSDQSRGMYLVRITSGEQNQTLKIQKL